MYQVSAPTTEFTSTRHFGGSTARPQCAEPSLEQLQPIVDNSDPLNGYIDNPRTYARNTATTSAFASCQFSSFSNTNLFTNLEGRYTTDRITNSQFIDSLFLQYTTPVNLAYLDWGRERLFSFGIPLRLLQSKINFDTDARYDRSLFSSMPSPTSPIAGTAPLKQTGKQQKPATRGWG
ncbi:MAG: hypothetical protein IPJ40_20285 [Saprospirales bacterium]|nr:hypothetical protein [Saprospirales bacterium]